MNDLVFGTVVICGVVAFGAAMTSLATFLNRHTTRIRESGIQIIRRRLLQRDDLGKKAILQALEITADQEDAAWTLISELASIFGVAGGHFRPDDRLADLDLVHRTELNEISTKTWSKSFYRDLSWFRVFGHEVLLLFDRFKGGLKLENAGKLPSPTPASEEECMEHILSFSVKEFIHVLLAE